MSLVNIFMERDRALISVDTLSSSMGAPAVLSGSVADALARIAEGIHAGKCAYLPHIGTAMAHRGDYLFASAVFSGLQLAMPKDFDVATEIMPGILAQTFAQASEFRRRQLGSDMFAGAEIVLVGWSPALNRMEGVRWVRWPGDNGFAAHPIGKVLLLPDAEWEQPPGIPDTPEAFERIARSQVAYVRANHAHLNCGGRLLLAEVTRDNLTVRTIADLDAETGQSPTD